MSIKAKLHLIESELKHIKESQDRMAGYTIELNDLSPFTIGDKLLGNDHSNFGKSFIVDELSVSYCSSSMFRPNPSRMPKYFIASGRIVKKDKTIGVKVTRRTIMISDVIESSKGKS